MTHTPGPWRIGGGLNNDGSRPISTEGPIASVWVRDENAPRKNLWQFNDPEREANARLIAAAPALLEALEGLKWKSVEKDNMEFGCRITCFQMDKILTAIAQAKGETK